MIGTECHGSSNAARDSHSIPYFILPAEHTSQAIKSINNKEPKKSYSISFFPEGLALYSKRDIGHYTRATTRWWQNSKRHKPPSNNNDQKKNNTEWGLNASGRALHHHPQLMGGWGEAKSLNDGRPSIVGVVVIIQVRPGEVEVKHEWTCMKSEYKRDRVWGGKEKRKS